MYKKIMMFGAAVFAAVVFSGCSALQTADKDDLTEVGMPCFLKDTVSAATLTDMITGKGKEMGGKRVIDLVTQSSSKGLLFKYCYATASGTVIK